MKRIVFAALLLIVSGRLVTPIQAQTYGISDQNSSVDVNYGSQLGISNWSINNAQQLAQQWFWYRVGDSGPESSINTLPLVTATVSDAHPSDPRFDTLFLRFGSASTFFIDIRYSTDGTSFSSAHIEQAISITNNSPSPLDFHFFEFTNFGLGGTYADDTATLLNTNAVQVVGDGPYTSETVVTPAANHYELALSPFTLDRLNDASPTTLQDGATTVGPGDETWAFEWDRILNPGENLQISQGMSLAIPEPSSLSLLSAGLAALAFWRGRA